MNTEQKPTVAVEQGALRDEIETTRNCTITLRQNGKTVFDVRFVDGVLTIYTEGGLLVKPGGSNTIRVMSEGK